MSVVNQSVAWCYETWCYKKHCFVIEILSISTPVTSQMNYKLTEFE